MASNLNIPIPDWLDKICVKPVLLYRRLTDKDGRPFRKIPLGRGKFAKVDPDDYYLLNADNWCLKENGPNCYAVRLEGAPKNRTKIISMHRQLLNPPKGLLVDHGNGLGLDNRRFNLRNATHSQNQYNKGKTRKNTSSRYVGVFFEKRTGKWCARIVVNGRRIWLGRFNTEEQAARAYDRAAIKYHGQFAHLNFPREDYINEQGLENPPKDSQ